MNPRSEDNPDASLAGKWFKPDSPTTPYIIVLKTGRNNHFKGGGYPNLTSLAYPAGRLDLIRFNTLAGAKGFEPISLILEIRVLPLNDTPIYLKTLIT